MSPSGLPEADRILAENRSRDRRHDDRYAPHLPFVKYLRRSQAAALHRALSRHDRLPPEAQTLLEVGCGTGNWAEIWTRLGGCEERLSGIDLDPARIEAARRRFPAADLRQGNAVDLPWPDRAFDLVFQSTMFSSILDDTMRRQVAGEMRRVVRAGGLLLWYDFFMDNPRNPAVRGISMREIRQLFPNCRIDSRRVVLAPPLARFLAPLAISLCGLVERLRLLNSFHFAVIELRTGSRRQS